MAKDSSSTDTGGGGQEGGARALLPAQWALPAAAPGSSEHTEPGQAVLPHQASEEAHTRPEVVSAHGQPSQSLSPVGQGLRLSWDVHLGLGTAVGWTMTHRPGPQPYHLGIAACEAQRHTHPSDLSSQGCSTHHPARSLVRLALGPPRNRPPRLISSTRGEVGEWGHTDSGGGDFPFCVQDSPTLLGSSLPHVPMLGPRAVFVGTAQSVE